MSPPKPVKIDETISSGVFYSQVTTTLQDVSQSTGRLEEKINTAIGNQAILGGKFEQLFEKHNILLERVINIEAQDVEGVNETLFQLQRSVDSIQQTLHDLDKRVLILSKHKEHVQEKLKDLEIQGVHLGIFKKTSEIRWSSILQIASQIITGTLLAYIAYALGTHK